MGEIKKGEFLAALHSELEILIFKLDLKDDV